MNQILAMSNQNKEQKKTIENDENKVNNNPNNIDEQINNGEVLPGTAENVANINIATPTITQDISSTTPEPQINSVNPVTPSVQNNIESVPVQLQVNSAQNNATTMPVQNIQNDTNLNNTTYNTQSNTNMNNSAYSTQNNVDLNNVAYNTQSNTNINNSAYGTQNNVDLNNAAYNTQSNTNMNNSAYSTQNNVNLNNTAYNTQSNTNMNNSAYGTQNSVDLNNTAYNTQNNVDLNNTGIGANMPNMNGPNLNEYDSNTGSESNSYNNQTENYNDYEGNRKQKKVKVRENNGGTDSGLIKRAAIIFSIILIIFAVVIIMVKLIPMIGKSGSASAPNAEINKPQIIISRLDENTISLSVKYTEEITKLRYWWNEDLEHIEEKNNNVLSMEVIIPDGEINTIHIEVQDKTGTITELSQDLVREKPKIQFIKSGDSIEIIAASDKGISSLVYYWNDEEANTVIPTEDDEYELSTTIEMRRGMNTLYAILTDTEGNTEQLDEMIKGVKKPEIKIQFSEDQLLAVIIISHDMGLEKIEFDVNGKTTVFDSSKSGYDSEKTSYRFKVAIKPGIVNTVTVRAYSNEDLNDTEKTSEEITKECDLTDVDTTE